ncbi:hypothetical protein CAEBREN_11285 [Caenorhabditis brenneri]|uniref:F-box domain-containing protein n=1 Tax=Caenorhabditis brenneri TaxID=135651 RepID=G0N0G6_CAEBE|nr:hypothetical protein CAEBREN_11285 [Caenorhabditis brenneri]
MAATPTFPLLGLPADEIRRTIRVMNFEQILRFSFLSKRCKNLVAGIQIKRMYFSVFISRSIAVIIHFFGSRYIRLEFYTEPDMYWGEGAYGRKKKLTAPQSVIVSHNGPIGFDIESSTWERNELTMQYWLKHLQDIFNYRGIQSIKFSTDSSQFDRDDIKQVFDSTTEIDIGNTGCVEFNQMVLRNYFPIDDLTIWTDNFRDSKIPPSLLMQNRVKLEVIDRDLDVPITLNDLLLINSKVIIVGNLLSPQQLPKDFITLWQKGSNPNLEYFCVEFSDDEETDEQFFMNGIKYEENPLDRVRNFKSVGFENPIEISGGLDIYRLDGVKATIKIYFEDPLPFFRMFVWFDHCVVEP